MSFTLRTEGNSLIVRNNQGKEVFRTRIEGVNALGLDPTADTYHHIGHHSLLSGVEAPIS